MVVPISDVEGASLLARTGLAGRALECDGAPYSGQRGYFGKDLEAVQSSAVKVLEEALRVGAVVTLPSTGYRVERVGQGRTLFSFDVAGRTKVSLVAVDHVRDSVGREGWAMEAWAECDPSELPSEWSEKLGVGVWEDRTGARAPVTRIQSFMGGVHCDWVDITFLSLGDRTYVRDVQGKLSSYLRTSYQDGASLPRTATDTGFRREGRELWVEPTGTAAYLVSLEHPSDVQRWPGAKQQILCA
jgi:hypothetical protein